MPRRQRPTLSDVQLTPARFQTEVVHERNSLVKAHTCNRHTYHYYITRIASQSVFFRKPTRGCFSQQLTASTKERLYGNTIFQQNCFYCVVKDCI